MSGYTEIVNTLKEIRNFLQQKMTPQLMGSLQAALDNINRLLGDPNLQANLRSSLESMAQLLQNINQQNVVGEIAGLARRLQEILAQVDPTAVANIINSLNNLLSAAEKANLIENIVRALNSVASLQDLVNVAKDLALPAKFAMYGVTGAVIGFAFTQAIQTFLKNKNDQKLQQSIDQLISINMQSYIIQVEQLRTNAQQFLLEVSRMEQRGFVLDEIAQQAKQEKIRLLSVLSPMDLRDLEVAEHIKIFCNRILRQLYQAEIQNQSMSDYLGYVGEHSEWDILVDYVAYSAQVQTFWGKRKPELSREQQNYKMIQKLYGTDIIDKIMQDLTNALAANGGNALYRDLANSYEDGTNALAGVIKTIPILKLQERVFFQGELAAAEQLWRYYAGLDANRLITNAWEGISWRQRGFDTTPELTPAIIDIIKKRACLEFCYQTVPYLCLPRNLPREIVNGVVDLPVGLWQIVRHPINSAANIGHTFFTVNGWKRLGSSIYAHPVRFLTTQTLTAGVSAGVSAGATYAFTPKLTVPAVPTTPTLLPKLYAPASVQSAAPVITAKTVGGVSVTTGTISSDLATEHPHNISTPAKKKSSVEMISVNKPEVIITAASTEQLINTLVTESFSTLEEFYGAIGRWYETNQQNNSKKAVDARSLGASMSVALGATPNVGLNDTNEAKATYKSFYK